MNDFEMAELAKQVKGLHELLEVVLANMEDEYGAEEEE
jgi:predicted component of type VI protein secretion system|tara:strand:+ start:59 stop:172 length:114 start_codon:yes stop_codon:yes gene_type:complete